MYRTLLSISGAWALLSAALAWLLWHKLQQGSNGSPYDFFLPGFYLVYGVLVQTASEALLLNAVYGLRWWRTLTALLLANGLAAVGMLAAAGQWQIAVDLDVLSSRLLLLPAAQAAIMLLLFLPAFAWLMRSHGRRWVEVWRVAALLKLGVYAVLALASISTGSYSLLRVPQVDARQLPLPDNQAVYFRAPDGKTIQGIHLARPHEVEKVPVLPRVRWPTSISGHDFDCRLPLALSDSTRVCSSRFYPAKFGEALRVAGAGGDQGYLKLVTLGMHLRPTHLFDLGNDLVLFQLGKSYIAVYDARSQRLAVLARGSSPVVAGDG